MMDLYKRLDGSILMTKYDYTDAGEELFPNANDGAYEKHVPQISINGDKVTVKVGDEAHPIAEEHWIMFIVLETKINYKVKDLKPGKKLEVTFKVAEPIIAVYECYNLHGLWKAYK